VVSKEKEIDKICDATNKTNISILSDTNQANKEMTKDAHYEKSSQQSSEDLTKYLADLTRGRNGHKPENLMFFLLVFLKNKTSCK